MSKLRVVGCHDKDISAVGGFDDILATDVDLADAQVIISENLNTYTGGCWPELVSQVILTEEEVQQRIAEQAALQAEMS